MSPFWVLNLVLEDPGGTFGAEPKVNQRSWPVLRSGDLSSLIKPTKPPQNNDDPPHSARHSEAHPSQTSIETALSNFVSNGAGKAKQPRDDQHLPHLKLASLHHRSALAQTPNALSRLVDVLSDADIADQDRAFAGLILSNLTQDEAIPRRVARELPHFIPALVSLVVNEKDAKAAKHQALTTLGNLLSGFETSAYVLSPCSCDAEARS